MMDNKLQNIINILNSEDRGDVMLGIEYFKQQNRYNRRRIIASLSNTKNSFWKDWISTNSWKPGNVLFHIKFKERENLPFTKMLSIKV